MEKKASHMVAAALLFGVFLVGELFALSPPVPEITKVIATPSTILVHQSTVLEVSALNPAPWDEMGYRWEQLEGPATIELLNPNAKRTTAGGFTVVGTYEFRITIDNGISQRGRVTVTVMPTVDLWVDITSHEDGEDITTSDELRIGVHAADAVHGIQKVNVMAKDSGGAVVYDSDIVESWVTPHIFDVGELAEGDYTIIATATNDQGDTAQDEITIFANTQSILSLMADPSVIRVDERSRLHVEATDNDGKALTYIWSKVSGPGEVVFSLNGSETSHTTDATFSEYGEYELEVSISNGDTAVTSQVPVTVLDTHAPVVDLDVGIEEGGDDDDGCGIASTTEDSSGAVWLIALIIVGLVARRRQLRYS